MRKAGMLGITVALLAAFAAVAYSQAPGDSVIIPAKDPTSGQQIGAVDWTAQTLMAKGSGVPPAGTTGPQGKLMACRAAEVVARRNLLELIKGMAVTSETQVVNYVTQSDTIRTKVEGIVQATTTQEKILSDGTCEVLVQLGIHETRPGLSSLADTVIPAKPAPDTAPPPISPVEPTATPSVLPVQSAVYTGIVVDARQMGARPAMAPRILDASGSELYGSAFVSREYAVQYGMAGYSRSVDAAMRNERVTATPLQVKAVKTSGSAKADIILSDDDAAKLRAAAKTQSFLAQARIMIVLD